jgi:hypothetical protein
MIKSSKGLMSRNGLVIIVFVFLLLAGVSTGIAQQSVVANNAEKPIIFKGLQLGMDIGEARKTMEKLVGKEWSVSPIDITEKVVADYRSFGGDREIFNDAQFYFPFAVGEKGFAVQNKSSKAFYGYVSTDESGNKVSRIALSGILVDYIFNTKDIDVENFVKELTKYYNLPELSWIRRGWQHTNAQKEYSLKITVWKLIDLKKEQTKIKTNPHNIEFN